MGDGKGREGEKGTKDVGRMWVKEEEEGSGREQINIIKWEGRSEFQENLGVSVGGRVGKGKEKERGGER